MTTVISVENLGKKYTLRHQQRESYTALRDVLANGAASIGQRLLHPFRKFPTGQQAQEEFWALKDVSFEVKQGDRIGIIGRNGAGKSTLLKILSRITEPTTGRVKIKGRVASLLEVGTGFHPELSGRENIYLNGAILGMSRAEIKKKFDEIVDFAEIEKFLDTPVKRYSSGMYVRLAFAVAAHLEPEILVVDEVLAVGDAQFQKKCLGKMGAVAREGRTILFVSHNMAAVTALCERAVLFTSGKIIRDDFTTNVIEDYLTGFQSITESNSVRDRVDRSGDGSMRITDLMFGTVGKENSGFWVPGENCVATISYQSFYQGPSRNIEIALGVRRSDQTPLAYLGTKVVQEDIAIFESIGQSICKIRRLPLEPGRYYINAEIKRSGIIADYVQSASTVEVEGGDFYGTGIIWPYGGVLCDYSWCHQ